MSIYDKCPQVRGVLRANASLKEMSRFGVGGAADVLFMPDDMDDLIFFLRTLPKDIPVIPLGAMSNVLIRDGGIRGVVIVLGDWFKKIYVEDGVIEVGAGAQCGQLVTTAMNNDLGGFEFLVGLPGTIGGAIKMNAGCFGSEIANVLYECEAVTSEGHVKWIKARDLDLGYRHSNLPDDWIITRAWFKGTQNVEYSIPKRVNEIVAKRKQAQPLVQRTCGSTFRNPECKKAWQLIDESGCRELNVRGARLSEKHCNFIVNDGAATAEDIESLGDNIVKTVLEKTGVLLEWEVVRLGERAKNE